MKTSALPILAVALCLSLVLVPLAAAGPSLPVTKPPVQPLGQMTGPPIDPVAAHGQWFSNAGGLETVRTNEFYDDIYGGPAGVHAISGFVDSITYLGGVPGAPIVAFSIQATIFNDTGLVTEWLTGGNQHGESLAYQNPPYIGPLVDTKLAAEFAIADTNTLPAVFTLPPYRDRQPYIIATNEDEWAWYCWNPLDQDPEHNPKGAFYVPTWDFGTIAVGKSASRRLQFVVPAGLPPVGDTRYPAIVASYATTNDILQNRTVSLKISTWIDDIALDSGGNEEPPLRYSDVSVFHNQGEETGLDFGDAPDQPYPTLLASDGARHVIDPLVYMGALIDLEADGQPDATATGDDKAAFDDEDGVAFLGPLIVGQSVTATVNCSTSGLLFAWVDFNANGSWADFGETQHAGTVMTQGLNYIAINVPAGATATNTFARFRFTTLSIVVSYTGLVANGEVEDYEVSIYAEGETPTLDFGDAADSLVTPGYRTLLANNGARHTVVPGVFLGASVDREPDGQPTLDASGDDVNPPAGIDDEDGVTPPAAFIAGSTAQVQVVASVPGFLNVWIDWNCNGTWIEPVEHVLWNQPLGPGVSTLAVPVPTPPTLVSGGPHSRWRFTTYPPPAPAYDGLATNGEVEDYEVRLEALDFGDAPDPSYPTLLASDGARHILDTNFCLGGQIDTEPDGWQSADATGDNTNGLPDEDGVNYTNVWITGQPGCMDILLSSAVNGRLDAWVDFDQDGAWSHPAEQVLTNWLLTPGLNAGICVNLPAGATAGSTFMRFRLSSAGSLPPTGLALDGEVEDYPLFIYQSGPTNPAGFLITNIVVEMSNNTYTILWDGESNVTYATQYRTSLVSTAALPWKAWGANITAPPWRQTDTNAVDTSKFYRVIAPYISP